MTFCREVNDAVNVFLSHQTAYPFEVADVHPHESVVGATFDVTQIGEIAGVGQLVNVNYLIFRIFIDEKSHYVASDEPGASRYHYCFGCA